jgi:hypothetical protein
MLLELEHSIHRNIIVPHSQSGRHYHVLFLRQSEGPFFVRDTAYKLDTLIQIGEIFTKLDEHRSRIVGNIFYTKSRVQCEGSFLLAYSGVFKEQAQRHVPSDLNMELVLKERGFQVFNQRNRATLIISPSLPSSIKANLEI